MDWKLEVVIVPVADVDRAKEFYADKLGFPVDVDHEAGEAFRIVHRRDHDLRLLDVPAARAAHGPPGLRGR